MIYTFIDISMPGGEEWLLMLLLIFPLYFLPAIIAKARKNSNTTAIFVLNLILGWTVLGWIGALIWAFSSGSKQAPTVIVNNTSQSYSQEYKVEKPNLTKQLQPEVASPKYITQQDKIDQLRQFKQLLDEGVITNEEFDRQKVAILGL
jgi:hypothetical protein